MGKNESRAMHECISSFAFNVGEGTWDSRIGSPAIVNGF